MAYDSHKNFAISKVAGAPSPATTGTTLAVTTGDGTKFPTPPFNAVVWPVNTQPTTTNAEIVRVTGISSDTLTITRAQESTSARTILVGDQIANAITTKSLTDIEAQTTKAVTKVVATTSSGFIADYYTDGTADDVEIQAALDAINALGGGTLLIKQGTYFISTVLNIYSNVTIMGEGMTSTILKKPTGNAHSNILRNYDRVIGNSNIRIHDLQLDGNYQAGDLDIIFYFVGVTNMIVERVKCYNGWEGFLTSGCSDVHFIECIGDGNYDWNFYNYSATRIKIINCQSLNAKHGVNEGFGMAVYATSGYCEISGNYIYNSTHNGIQFNAGSGSADNVGGLIKDNIVVNPGNYGIMITDDTNTFHVKKVSVVNNRVTGSTFKGLYMIDAYDAYVAGNKLYGNTTDGIAYENCVNLMSVGNVSTGNNVGLRIVGDGTSIVSDNDWIYSNTTNFAPSNSTSGLTTIGPTDFTLNGQANRSITVNRTTTSATIGSDLTVQAGGAISGSTDKNGGNLVLSGGIATGNNASSMKFQVTPAAQGTGTTDRSPQLTMLLSAQSTNLRGRLSLGTGSSGTVDGITLGGNFAYQLFMSRNTTGNSAGNSLTITSGGATASGSATDKAAGDLVLSTGISTGTGTSQILFKTASIGSTGTTDNTITTRLTLNTILTSTVPIVLPAGTATANTAPLKLTTGTALTTPEDGVFEYHTSHLYFTIGSTRYQLDQQGGGSVSSVSGTTNRISSTGGATPVIDIDAAYVGQSSITTLGTITTGVWSGTAIDHSKLTGIVQADVGGLTTASTPTFAGANLGSGNLSTVGNISIDGSAARDITVAQASGTTGRNLIIQAGQSVTGGTNEVGGQLMLKAGVGTGSDGNGAITFHPATAVGSGTTTQSTSEKMRLSTGSAGRLLIGTTTSSSGLVQDGITLGGANARGVQVNRHSTNNTAGVNLTITSGGASATSSTDKAAGTLILNTGVSTGTGTAQVKIQTMTKALSTGTGDNTATDRLVITSPLSISGTTTLVSATLASNTSIGQIIRYSVECTNGTDYQVETGEVFFAASNKGGVFTVGTPVKVGTVSALSGASTMSTSFTQSSANPSIIAIAVTTSLTPSTGYPRITFSVDNLTQQAITVS